MKKLTVMIMVVLTCGIASADTFGTGANEFDIDFVEISGATNPSSGYGIVNNDYRMGKFEISNDQWNKFRASHGMVKDSLWKAYDLNSKFTGTNVPVNNLSWYEGAQFVNWLNTSTGHQAAYKFTGGTFEAWSPGDAGYDASNPFRNSYAHYFMPTEDEWVKAAYWNGTSLQTYATVGDLTPTHSGWNFYDSGYATDPYINPYIPYGLWNVGSGSEELNGTFDMMGNMWEWMESFYYSVDYLSGSPRGIRGGSYDGYSGGYYLSSSERYGYDPYMELYFLGFRVASKPLDLLGRQ